MRKTEYAEITGVTRWFQHIDPEVYEIGGKKQTNWKHKIWPNPGSLELIRELQAEGIKNQLKKDEDGYFINFSRPVDITKHDGTKILLGAPKVTDDQGSDLSQTRVGDGSHITTTLEVYQHRTPGGGSAKAARWLSTVVHSLVPVDAPGEIKLRKPPV